MITVYFDTCFFVWLAKADNDEASHLISELNELDVRHVVSLVHFREMCVGGREYEANNLRLYKRINALKHPPLQLDASWDFLLGTSEQLDSVNNLLSKVQSQADKATAMSLSISKLTETEQERWNQVHGYRNGADGYKAARECVVRLKHIYSALGLDILDLPETLPSDPRELIELSENIFASIPQNLFKKVKVARELDESVFAGATREVKVTLANASEKTARRVAHDLADSDHMHAFVDKKDVIDFLQVDRKQLNKINHPGHYLQRENLAQRCFGAPDLNSIPGELRRLLGA